MTTIQRSSEGRDARPGSSGVLWSWAALALLPVSFMVAFWAAHLPYMVFDYPEYQPGPWWFNLLGAVIAFGILWLPVGLSLLIGVRAARAGSRAARVPVVLDLVLTAAAVVAIVVSTFQ